jgi:8-oxo-dGTP diphosphatase
VRLHDVAEDASPAFTPLTHAIVIARSAHGFVLVLNRALAAWELPGGAIDDGETPRVCAMREFTEETGQMAPALRWRGVAELTDRSGRVEFGGLYCVDLADTPLPPYETGEIAQVGTWARESLPRPMSAIDVELLALFR